MAQQVISTTISGADTAVSLDDSDDDLLLTATGVLESTQRDGITANSTDHDLIIEGRIEALNSAVVLGFTSGGLRNSLVVEQSGSLKGGIYGVFVDGALTTIENHGTIECDGAAVTMSTHGTGTSSLSNSGTIRGTTGIDFSGSESFSITNTGLIEATDFHAVYVDTAEQDISITFVNSGEIIGYVSLSSGNDVFDGAAGTVDGAIEGNDGDDRLTAGAGADTIVGGLGRDILAGGDDADFFVFQDDGESGSKKKTMDVITDFSRKDGDVIDLAEIDAKTGRTADDTFRFIGDDDFHGRKGELRFDIGRDKTFIEADIDGDGKTDFAIMLIGEITMRKGDFEL